MKNILCLSTLIILLLSQNLCFATGFGYQYIDGGTFFSDVVVPNDAVKNINYKKDIPDTFTEPPRMMPKMQMQKLKHGTSHRTNIFKLVEWGDSGIYAACKKGHISKIHYVETSVEKVYIPIFAPIYYNKITTNVYGE